LPLVVGLVLALALAAGGFCATYFGLLPLPGGVSGSAGPDAAQDAAAADDKGPSPPPRLGTPEFVAVEPLVVTLGPAADGRHLRFRAELEVAPGRAAAVTRVMPRILDVLNGYLRAVPVEELESPSALVRLRAQMLRRIQLVAGEGVVRDLLVTEFVLT
jgi:flagellar FliL protein